MLLHLCNYCDKLLNRSLMEQLSATQQLHQTDELLHTLWDNPQAFQSCFSNNHYYCHYWYCAFRYFEDATLT